MSRSGFFLLFLISMLRPAFASTDAMEKAVFATLHLSEFETMPPEQRRRLVDASLAYWRNFDGRVPRNSPADAKWLKGELNTTDMNRIRRASQTQAFALMQLSDLSTFCIGIFESLVPAVGGEKAIELYLWLKATRCYFNNDTAIYLQRARLSNGRDDGAFKMRTFSSMLSTITGKLSNSIINE